MQLKGQLRLINKLHFSLLSKLHCGLMPIDNLHMGLMPTQRLKLIDKLDCGLIHIDKLKFIFLFNLVNLSFGEVGILSFVRIVRLHFGSHSNAFEQAEMPNVLDCAKSIEESPMVPEEGERPLLKTSRWAKICCSSQSTHARAFRMHPPPNPHSEGVVRSSLKISGSVDLESGPARIPEWGGGRRRS